MRHPRRLTMVALAISVACSSDDTTHPARRPIVSIRIYPRNPALRVGEELQLNDSIQTIPAGLPTTVRWRSSAPSVVSVTAAGLVTANASGSALIKALWFSDSTWYDSTFVTVVLSRGVRSVIVEPGSVLMTDGQEVQLTARVDVSAPGSAAVRWRSSDTAVVHVSPDGLLTKLCGQTSSGISRVTATSVEDPTIAGVAEVTVRYPLGGPFSVQKIVSVADSQPVNMNAVQGLIAVTVNTDETDCMPIERYEVLLRSRGLQPVETVVTTRPPVPGSGPRSFSFVIDTRSLTNGSYDLIVRRSMQQPSLPRELRLLMIVKNP
jgi:hypothetical protein